MKHLLPLALCTVAVAGGTIYAVNAHRDYTHQIALQNAQKAAQAAKAAQIAKQQDEAQATKIKRLQVECQKGLTAYNALPVAQRKTVVKPDCAL